jgi:hypothetical protein
MNVTPRSTLRQRLASSALALAAGALLVTAAPASAELQVPQPSPSAKVEQQVGISTFQLQYSSPGVKGRTIWGGVVPLDKPWRTGANASTKLVASHDFTFGGKKVPAGSYALYSIPGKDSWTLVLNTSADSWGAMGYDTKKDVARVTVKPQAIPSRERMTFVFTDTTDDTTNLDLEWEKVRVSVPLKVDTKGLVLANIDQNLNEAWRPHFTAARWLLDSGGDLNAALKYVDTSIAVKPTWWNHWVKAQVLAKQGKSTDAVQAGTKAQELGKGDRVYEGFFKGEIEKSIADWKKKA